MSRSAGGAVTARLALRSAIAERSGAATWLHALLPLALAAVWVIDVSRTRVGAMSDLGLVSVLPRTSLAVLGALTVSFCIALTRRRPSRLVLLVHVVVLVVLLYGVTTFVEQVPRSGTVYRHTGIIEYIAGTGTVDPTIDAYFNWPGFFAMGALITKIGGFSSPLAFAGWGPLLFNLLFLAPLVAIFRSVSDDERVVWLGLWLFYAANWVGQDIVSPQAVGYLLWLVILAVLLRYFTGRATLAATAGPGWLRARWTTLHVPVARAGPAQRAGLLLAVVAIFAAIVTGHQLTPFAAILTCVALVAVARLEPRTLPLLMALMTAAWIVYMAEAYLAGNLRSLLKPIGDIGANLNQNVGSRVAGSAEHQFIVHLRIYSSVAIWLLAVAGVVRRVRAGRGDVAMIAVGGAPLALAVLQPYGGEMVLRVFLFSLPALAFFGACLAFPSPAAGRGWRTTAVLVAGACALLATFMFTRYGNERLDYFSPGDLAASRALYRIAPRGSTVVAGSGGIPLRYRDYNGYRYVSVSDLRAWRRPAPRPRRLAAELQLRYGATRSFLIITPSTKVWASLLEGKPGALDGLSSTLRRTSGVRIVYDRGGATIFAFGRGR